MNDGLAAAGILLALALYAGAANLGRALHVRRRQGG